MEPVLDAAAQEEYNCAVETRILARIPDNWGKYVSCQTGWYPLLDVLDSRLAGINPDYCIFQVKQKFGRLVCYFDIPTPDPENLTEQEYSAQVKKEEEQLRLMRGIVEDPARRAVQHPPATPQPVRQALTPAIGGTLPTSCVWVSRCGLAGGYSGRPDRCGPNLTIDDTRLGSETRASSACRVRRWYTHVGQDGLVAERELVYGWEA